MKRLWRATSEGEILRVAGEETRQLLPCFELIFARRVAAFEETQFPQLGGNSTARLAEARAYAFRRFTPQQFARLEALWQRTAAGSVADRSGGRTSFDWSVSRCASTALIRIRQWPPTFADRADPRSWAACRTRPHDVSELERTVLSTIADFASLALH